MTRPWPLAEVGVPAINLHHLHAFERVAAAGGIRRSAQEMFRASSALTRSVAKLEQTLGTALFERKGRGMLITAAGERVLVRARRIDTLLQGVMDDAGAAGAATQATQAAMRQALQHAGRLTAVSLLVDARHMPTVAAAMKLSQPAISASIAKVEAALRRPLFHRSAHGLLPTEHGERWTIAFRRVLAELRHMEADLAALGGALEGVVNVGALPFARTTLLPDAVVALHAMHPRLCTRTFEKTYQELCAGLLDGQIDFIVGPVRVARLAGLTIEVLFTQGLSLIARAGHPLAAKRRLCAADLAGFPWALSRRGTPLREEVNGLFGELGLPAPAPVVETADVAMLRCMLLRSDMLTATYTLQLAHEVRAGTLVELALPVHRTQRQIGITTREGAQLSPGAQTLLGEVRRQSQAIARTAPLGRPATPPKR